MAAIGSAVGLGNLWRFPFQTGEHGGSAFVIVYLVCVAFVAYPILMGELAVGRHGGRSAVGSTTQLAKEAGRSPAWGLTGWVGVTGSFCIFTTYSVIAGQVMAYAAMSLMGEFAGRAAVDAAAIAPLYDGPGHAVLWHTLLWR
jgi:NSS family neurotransmitter:Na+ symporter